MMLAPEPCYEFRSLKEIGNNSSKIPTHVRVLAMFESYKCTENKVELYDPDEGSKMTAFTGSMRMEFNYLKDQWQELFGELKPDKYNKDRFFFFIHLQRDAATVNKKKYFKMARIMYVDIYIYRRKARSKKSDKCSAIEFIAKTSK